MDSEEDARKKYLRGSCKWMSLPSWQKGETWLELPLCSLFLHWTQTWWQNCGIKWQGKDRRHMSRWLSRRHMLLVAHGSRRTGCALFAFRLVVLWENTKPVFGEAAGCDLSLCAARPAQNDTARGRLSRHICTPTWNGRAKTSLNVSFILASISFGASFGLHFYCHHTEDCRIPSFLLPLTSFPRAFHPCGAGEEEGNVHTQKSSGPTQFRCLSMPRGWGGGGAWTHSLNCPLDAKDVGGEGQFCTEVWRQSSPRVLWRRIKENWEHGFVGYWGGQDPSCPPSPFHRTSPFRSAL